MKQFKEELHTLKKSLNVNNFNYDSNYFFYFIRFVYDIKYI